MREIRLDFQPQRPGLLAVTLFLAGLLLAADAWLEDRQLREQQADLDARVALLERRLDRQTLSRRDAEPEKLLAADEAKALRAAMAAIAVDWEALFQRIDQATSEDVALQALRPNVPGQSLQLSGEARDLKAALAFVDALRGGPLSKVALLSHQERQNDPQRPIVFEIVATWQTTP